MTWEFSTILNLIKQGGAFSWFFSLCLAVFFTGAIKGALQKILEHLKKLAEKTTSKWDDILVHCVSKTSGILIFIWIYFLLIRVFETHEGTLKFSKNLVIVATLIQFWIWGFNLIRHWKDEVLKPKMSADSSSAAAIGLLYSTSQVVFFVTLVLIGLSNLGFDIGALLAGLGVGGIAVALAAQNVLGDLLASLSIVLDKPFVLGDFIVVGNEKGTIEYIGLKTTRLRSISGEELIFSNKDLLESRIQNHKRMWKRRVVNTFGIVYSTPLEQIEKVPGWVKDIVAGYPQLTLDRCHFINLASSSLDFEYVVWMNSPDYNQYLDVQEKIYLDIMRKFKQENIEFAYNTQTLYIQKSN
jgi:small-conductance mechanosensitive channel